MKKDIITALEQNVLIRKDDIEIEVVNGSVFLRGAVPTFAARKAAYEAALYTPGVVNIFDEIEVLSKITPAVPETPPG